MADGDAANAIGLAIMTGVEKVKDVWKQVNKTRDMIANHITAGTHAGEAITTGTIDSARLPTIPTTKLGQGNWDMGVATLKTVNVDAGGGNGKFATLDISGVAKFVEARANPVTTSYVAAYLNSDNRLGASPSSRRFKRDIQEWSPDKKAALAIQIMTFRLIAAVEDLGDEAPYLVGPIAEELHELGLTHLVHYGDDGKPFGIHHEWVIYEFIPMIQDHEARLNALENGAS